jgi:hypothetical protein
MCQQANQAVRQGVVIAPRRESVGRVVSALRSAMVVLAALGAIACGGDNTLEGSVDQVVPLGFDSVAVSKQGTVLAVDYVRNVSDGIKEITARLTFDTGGEAVDDSTVVDGERFMQAVRLQRATRANNQFPDVQSGSLRFSTLELKDGGSAQGEFDIAFVDGHLLLGKFDGTIHEE